MEYPFTKMNGAGNDFVIFDARKNNLRLSPQQVRAVAARSNTVTKGCDQVIVIEPSNKADVFMRIFNADGGEVDACGNATRCVAHLVTTQNHQDTATIETLAGVLDCRGKPGDTFVAANMGEPKWGWQDIPLAKEADTLHLPVSEGPLSDAVGVSMGNPHAVFFVDDVKAIDLATIGPKLEHHPMFPKRANIGVAQFMGKDRDGHGIIHLRVWERGAGETPSCGTGACAAMVAANRRGLCGESATIETKGGTLEIDWLEKIDVLLSGKVEKEFMGTVAI